ncbi:Conserved_hypothetical protein [Hexamita inflata]|uniref:Uncharacterized protein n=1 Tax=Hexamita inflata TaxID=28002 RepID=A0AA86P8B3_9EUKA|nr:Conserved hypothetical protein [Hexamita inflata]CAI9935174.1 Conserved hypothetical protein [Hexamita inflata]
MEEPENDNQSGMLGQDPTDEQQNNQEVPDPSNDNKKDLTSDALVTNPKIEAKPTIAAAQPITGLKLEENSKKKCKCECNCCPQLLNNDCLQLYLGCQPAVEANNCGLALINCIICGSGLCCASCCESPLPKGSLVCAGLCQFITAFTGVGIVVSFMAGMAMCFEDSCW